MHERKEKKKEKGKVRVKEWEGKRAEGTMRKK
jgi:hypothetical protein